MINVFDITEFGAVGDGAADCTGAIRAACAAAEQVGGVVAVPPGVYCSGPFRLGKGVSLEGHAAWSYRSDGGSVIRLNDPEAACLVDITGAFGCAIRHLCLDGCGLGEGIHGVRLAWPEYNGGSEEDTPVVDDCRIGGFTGDGVHLFHIWCFSVRHCMLHRNRGAGLFVDGWDGFILDNWFSGNGNGGLRTGTVAASLTVTGNRVEWNRRGGFLFGKSDNVNITGNFFDRSGGPAVLARGGEDASAREFTLTGNVFRRNGKPDWDAFEDPYLSSHVYLDRCANWTVTGNNFVCGADDAPGGVLSPDYGVVFGRSAGIVVKNNTMWCGSMKETVTDLGGNRDVIAADNPGAPSPGGDGWWPQL
ncbi:MAG: right-handed parallel beta-helix repeat-containing protein [Oscillospiraceae bacterium]|nr:right-handed parallel beta-helix repeat-containing protein [Oscillospiraceae bacterium]